MLATLKQAIQAANAGNYALPGLVVLGWEDACAYVQAAEAEQAPIILQAGPGCMKHTPMPIIAATLRHLAEQASVPVVVHLDHGKKLDDCFQAIDLGFSSVMFDGSELPLDENIELSARLVERARAAGVSVEGEVGFVGYDQGENSRSTDPQEAQRFARESGVDAVAIAIGNVHLQQNRQAQINMSALRAIEALTGDTPLVIHGGSGLNGAQRRELATKSKVGKINIGTELRMAFGAALKANITANPELFDRIALLKPAIEPVCAATRNVIREMRPG